MMIIVRVIRKQIYDKEIITLNTVSITTLIGLGTNGTPKTVQDTFTYLTLRTCAHKHMKIHDIYFAL